MSNVRIAALKAQLSEYLRKVRGGRTLVVLDRNTPIARIVPYDGEAPLEIQRATRKPAELRLPSRPKARTDSVAVLLQDRAAR
ncbi:MAG: prevent-host-death protein [Acidobacteria bacterium]|nr:MAG: prevent-host-death protein [Acidobacteriota bacterium]PYQ19123.1 MAG: prevent-host-death protein [Acidobacteriota bacterium]